jgi:transposase-like protein
MPRPFPAEFRLRAVVLVRAGKSITSTTQELGISAGALHNWVRQDRGLPDAEVLADCERTRKCRSALRP